MTGHCRLWTWYPQVHHHSQIGQGVSEKIYSSKWLKSFVWSMITSANFVSYAITSAKVLFFSVCVLYGLSWATGIWGGFGMLFTTVAAKVFSACWKFWSILCNYRREWVGLYRIYTFIYLPQSNNTCVILEEQLEDYINLLLTSWPWGDWNNCATAAKASGVGSWGTTGTTEALVIGGCICGWGSAGTVQIQERDWQLSKIPLHAVHEKVDKLEY